MYFSPLIQCITFVLSFFLKKFHLNLYSTCSTYIPILPIPFWISLDKRLDDVAGDLIIVHMNVTRVPYANIYADFKLSTNSRI